MVREALFDHSRARDESMAQYVHRRMQQFLQAESLGIHIPAEIRGTMLEEGAQLSEQGMQNLRTLTKGSTDFSVVKRALLDLDIPRDRLLKKSMMVEDSQEDTFVAEEDSDVDPEGELFDELAGMDLDEKQAVEVFAILEKNHYKRRTWRENKDLRKAIRKDRQHFDRVQGSQNKNDKGRTSTIDRLKAITKCSNCGMKGHWHRECPNPSDGKGPASSGSMAIPSNGFTYTGFGRESFSTFLSESNQEVTTDQVPSNFRIPMSHQEPTAKTEEIVDAVSVRVAQLLHTPLNHMQAQILQFGSLLQQLQQGQSQQWQALASLGIEAPKTEFYQMDLDDWSQVPSST